jgi:hypothetical protein
VSSKTARLRRRQAVRREEHRRPRKADRVPMHTTAERRRAAVDRQHKREVEQHRDWWRRRFSGSLAATVTTSAASAVIAVPVATVGIWHLYKPYSAASQFYSNARTDSDHPDYPHTPEGDPTFYTPWYRWGTATTSIRIGPETSK